MAITVTNTGSTYTSEASVPNSANRWAVLGFTANAGASGSVVWWVGTAASAGSPLIAMICASGQQTFQAEHLFNSATGFFAASVTTGSANIWLRVAS